MELLSFDRLLGIFGALFAIAAIGFGLAMDTRNRAEVRAAIACFSVAAFGFLCTIGVWTVTTELDVTKRIAVTALLCAALGVLLLESIRWSIARHEAKNAEQRKPDHQQELPSPATRSPQGNSPQIRSQSHSKTTSALTRKKGRPPISKTESFESFMVWNTVWSQTNPQSVPFTCPYKGATFLRQDTCSQMAKIANANFTVPPLRAQFPPGFIQPSKEWNIRHLCAEIVQHYLLFAVHRAAEGFHRANALGSVIDEEDVPSINTPDQETYYVSAIGGSYNPAFISALFDPQKTKFILPSKSTIEFEFTSVFVTLAPGQPDTYWLTIERDGYYRLRWKVTTGPQFTGQLPPKWETWLPASLAISYGTKVQFDYTIERREDDPSFVTEDYVEWVKQLSDNIQQQMSP